MPGEDRETGDDSLRHLLTEWECDSRDLLARLRFRPHPDGVMPAAELAGRTLRLRALRHTMMPREFLKQRYLWPLIRRHVRDGHSVVDDLARHKKTFERELIKMRWADDRSVNFDDHVRTMAGYVENYVAYEERLLPRFETEIPAAERAAAVNRMRAAHRIRPLAPHPELPAAPWLAVPLVPIVSALDRVRDRLSTAPG